MTLPDAASDHAFPDAHLRLLCNPIAPDLTLLVVLVDAAADGDGGGSLVNSCAGSRA